MRTRREWLVGAVLLAFTVIGTVRAWSVAGEDLTASYIGCRVVASGQADHLYRHDSQNFSVVNDPVWNALAKRTEITTRSLVHPYVQTPLWAYGLGPLCTRTSFSTFCRVFTFLLMLSVSGTLWLVSRYWVPAVFHPGWMALICAALYRSEPMRYTLFLAQTHPIFVFLSVLALVLSRANKPVWAGICLAAAASVKITPGYLVIYWLMTRQTKAALSFLIASAVLVVCTVAAVGPQLTLAYVREMSELSNVLLVSFNNQSFPAWWMGHWYPSSELFHWNMYRMPAVLKFTTALLAGAATVIGGLLDRRRMAAGLVTPPYGAVIALLGAMIFAPIAWTHYYILLVIPVMLLMGEQMERSSRVWVVFLLVILSLNFYPVAYGTAHELTKNFSIARSHFFSGIFCLVALGLLHRSALRRPVQMEMTEKAHAYVAG